MMLEDDDFEPVRGLPQELPEGEHILWQGGPNWSALAKRLCHVRAVTAYFAILMVWRAMEGWQAGMTPGAATAYVADLMLPMALALTLLAGLAYVIAKTTIYTITNKRVVIRTGVALSKTINLPFAQIAGAAVKQQPDGTQDAAITLSGKNRPAYLLLWPSVRPFGRPIQPMLRGVPQSEGMPRILAQALTDYHGDNAEGLALPAPQHRPDDRPLGVPAPA